MSEQSSNSDQGQLLLYLSNELSPAERRTLESRLMNDAALRRELELLQEVEATLNQGLSAMDTAAALDTRIAERQVARALSQWQVDRLERSTEPLAMRKVKRVPIWLYPLAAAAVVMVCLGLWYLSFDRNDDGTLAEMNEPRRALEMGVPDDDEPTPDLELAVTDGDSFGELEEEMSKLVSLSRAFQ